MSVFQGVRGVVLLALLASVGLTLLLLGCALSGYNWFPTFVIIFYVLSPIPLSIARRCSTDTSYSLRDTNPCSDLMWFITSALIVSAFGLPIILYRSSVIVLGSMGFIIGANVLIYLTIAIYFLTYGNEDTLAYYQNSEDQTENYMKEFD